MAERIGLQGRVRMESQQLLRRSLIGFVLAVACGASDSALAQRDVAIQRFDPALDAQGLLGVQGTRTPASGSLSFGAFTHYGSDLLEVEQGDGERIGLLEHRLGLDLSVEIGIGPRAALGFSAPFMIYQEGERLGALSEVQAFGLGDQRLSARYRFLGDVPKDVLARNDGPGLALQVDARLPGGDDDRYLGEGMIHGGAQLLADMHVLGYGVAASVGFHHRFESRSLFGLRLRDEFTFGAGLRMPVPAVHPLGVMFEVRGASDFKGAATTAVEGALSFTLPLGAFTLVASAGPGFTGGIGVAGVRGVLGLWYAPKDSDADHDGVPDERDECPPLLEDRDGHEDQDGCPDPDNDNDLVPDADDLCPNVEALEGQDADEDGCTDPSQ